MDRASALDAAFLQLEGPHASLHIGSVALFDGPAPDQGILRELVARRLTRVPRCRQRLLRVPLALGRPVWADDPDFDLDDHFLRVGVPAPGGPAEFEALVDELMSRSLDQSRPLWQDWVVDGLADGTWAVVSKAHHTLVDGIAGTGLLTAMLDDAQDDPGDDAPDWSPAPLPGAVRLVGSAVTDGIRDLAGGLSGIAGDLRSLPRTALATARGLWSFTGAARPTAPSPLIGPLGTERAYRWTEVPLETVLDIRAELGGTVNDIVLAAATRAFRDLLLHRGEEPADGSVRTLVPVSVRRGDQHGDLDNRVSALLLEMPVELADPMDRYTEVAVRMRRLKGSHEADAGERLTAWGDLVPAPALTGFLHAAFRAPHRHLTTVVTNVPGPTRTLHFAGRRMRATYPYVPIADRIRTGLAVTSYEDKLFFGVTADRESVADVDLLAAGIGAGFDELVAMTHARGVRQ